MTTVVLGQNLVVDALIELRRVRGLDGHDEVWEGVYHMVPHAHSRHGKTEARLLLLLAPLAQQCGLEVTTAFNLGVDATNYRVPDLGVREPGEEALFVPTARMVVEVLSPDDETFAKFGFYGARGVEEILVVDPETQTVRCWQLRPGSADRMLEYSSVLGVSCERLRQSLAWP